jgi:hypothetical protein
MCGEALLKTQQPTGTSGIGFLDHLERTRMRIERVTKAGKRSGTRWVVRTQTDTLYSPCDARNLVVMERLKINQAIVADDDSPDP